MEDNIDRISPAESYHLDSPRKFIVDFCLACDRQIESGKLYCSEACRIADLEKGLQDGGLSHNPHFDSPPHAFNSRDGIATQAFANVDTCAEPSSLSQIEQTHDNRIEEDKSSGQPRKVVEASRDIIIEELDETDDEPDMRAPSPSNPSRERRGGIISKDKARNYIPAERNLQNIDQLIQHCEDERELEELKHQKRLLKKRQAALDTVKPYSVEEVGDIQNLSDLHVEFDSDSEEERVREYRKMKRRRQLGVSKRNHDQSIEGDFGFSDNDPLEDNDFTARRLRRRIQNSREHEGRTDQDFGSYKSFFHEEKQLCRFCTRTFVGVGRMDALRRHLNQEHRINISKDPQGKAKLNFEATRSDYHATKKRESSSSIFVLGHEGDSDAELEPATTNWHHESNFNNNEEEAKQSDLIPNLDSIEPSGFGITSSSIGGSSSEADKLKRVGHVHFATGIPDLDTMLKLPTQLTVSAIEGDASEILNKQDLRRLKGYFTTTDSADSDFDVEPELGTEEVSDEMHPTLSSDDPSVLFLDAASASEWGLKDGNVPKDGSSTTSIVPETIGLGNDRTSSRQEVKSGQENEDRPFANGNAEEDDPLLALGMGTNESAAMFQKPRDFTKNKDTVLLCGEEEVRQTRPRLGNAEDRARQSAEDEFTQTQGQRASEREVGEEKQRGQGMEKFGPISDVQKDIVIDPQEPATTMHPGGSEYRCYYETMQMCDECGEFLWGNDAWRNHVCNGHLAQNSDSTISENPSPSWSRMGGHSDQLRDHKIVEHSWIVQNQTPSGTQFVGAELPPNPTISDKHKYLQELFRRGREESPLETVEQMETLEKDIHDLIDMEPLAKIARHHVEKIMVKLEKDPDNDDSVELLTLLKDMQEHDDELSIKLGLAGEENDELSTEVPHREPEALPKLDGKGKNPVQMPSINIPGERLTPTWTESKENGELPPPTPLSQEEMDQFPYWQRGPIDTEFVDEIEIPEESKRHVKALMIGHRPETITRMFQQAMDAWRISHPTGLALVHKPEDEAERATFDNRQQDRSKQDAKDSDRTASESVGLDTLVPDRHVEALLTRHAPDTIMKMFRTVLDARHAGARERIRDSKQDELNDSTASKALAGEDSVSIGLGSDLSPRTPEQMDKIWGWQGMHMAQKKVISRPENLEAFDQERDILRALAGDRHAHIVKLIDSHIDEGPQGTASEPVLDDDYDNESVISSYAASVISVQSLASSATDLSNGSGYSAHQIATATKELVTIFQEDDLLKPLYKRAINDDSIGPEKLERNLRRLFKQYAEHLKGEATDGLEYLAARLVTLKARFLAQSIVQSFKCNDRPKAREKIPKEESSDEEEESQTVDDAMFDDLIIFREFLVGSDAFQRLKAQIQSFVLPKVTLMAEGKETHTIVPVKDISTIGNLQGAFSQDASIFDIFTLRQISNEAVRALTTRVRGFVVQQASRYLSTQAAEGNEPPYQSSATSELMSRISSRYERANWSIYWRLRRTWEAFLVVSGCLEPPLEPGKVRLRWRCKCGDSFSGDFTEYKEDGIAELASDMLRATGTEVTITTHSSSSSNQKYMGQHPGLWIRNALVRLTTTFRKPAKQYTLPQHNSANVTCCPAPSPNPPPNKMLHLFSCMHAGRFRKSLTQDRIDSIDTDRNLFCFLREQFRLHRGRFVTLLSLKAVQGIYFIKFRLPMGGSVEVRPHNPCCIIPQSCECIPPAHRVEPKGTEYRCIPGPPPVWPPIDPHYLAHLFTTPSCINENDTWILDQLPKRICGELQGKAGQPAEGWGIYYLESWDRDVITLLLVTLFLLMSLVFGVLWSCLKMDVQGAFGVSAYMMAACAVLVGLVTMKVDKV